jgi:quercetin dioxygenase-like cupin family protein
MQIEGFEFDTIEWDRLQQIEHPGEKGIATWRTVEVGGMRLRQVEYSPGYVADHWCEKGHVVLVLEGELITELSDGRRFTLHPGMSYHVADGRAPHRSSTTTGARLFVLD